MSSGSRERGTSWAVIVGAAVVLALLAGASLAFDRYVRERPSVAPAPAPVVTATPSVVTPDAGELEAPVAQARIVALTGEVQRSGGSETGEGVWTPVKLGELLGENQRLRTSRGATAELAIGEASSMVVSEATEVGVIEISQAVERFKLVRGRITAEAAPGNKRVLRIEGDDGQHASSSEGRFSVLATGQTFTVATERGQVNLESAGKVITVDAGHQASARVGAQPVAAVPIAAEVLLLAARAQADCAEINGTAPPGAEVHVGDALAVVDDRGRFRVKLASAQRPTSVRVHTRDAAGHVQERIVKCRSRPPQRGGKVDDIAIQRWHKTRK